MSGLQTHLSRLPVLAEAYRKAVDLNPRDYRAWYGLGQTYELLHMPVYALHYYQRATQVPHPCLLSEEPAAGTGLTTIHSVMPAVCLRPCRSLL